jgi:hypothetical protein
MRQVHRYDSYTQHTGGSCPSPSFWHGNDTIQRIHLPAKQPSSRRWKLKRLVRNAQAWPASSCRHRRPRAASLDMTCAGGMAVLALRAESSSADPDDGSSWPPGLLWPWRAPAPRPALACPEPPSPAEVTAPPLLAPLARCLDGWLSRLPSGRSRHVLAGSFSDRLRWGLSTTLCLSMQALQEIFRSETMIVSLSGKASLPC